MSVIVTIDGPAASGKSSVSRDLAKKFGWSWVSTGSFYRGLAYVAHELKFNLDREQELAALAQSDVWEVRMEADRTCIYFQGQDVTQEAHTEFVGTIASKISQYPKVREALLSAQRNCAKNQKGLIAEGRDCGSVVFPLAQVKIYLTADQEARAMRRSIESGEDASQVVKVQTERDQRDSSRKVAPLHIPFQAVVVDTDNLSLNEVVAHVEKIISEKLKVSNARP